MIKFLLFFFSLVFSSDGIILTIEDKSFSIHDFFSRYPKKQWERADSLQKEKMFNDFINRKLCVFEAQKLGFQNDPESAVTIYNRSLQVLINESYEYFVARPLIPDEDIDLARQNAKKEIFVSHILIGHSESYLGRPPQRTVDEALVLSQQIKEDFIVGGNFAVLAEKYSDDPGVRENSGKIGWVSWGATVPEFQLVAFSLDQGTISSPVLTNFGYHLILVSDVRPSDYQYMDDPAYESLIVNITKNSIRDKLRPAAIEYDKKMIEEHGVLFNMDAVKEILTLYGRHQKEFELSGGKGASASFLETMSSSTVVCVYNNKGYGPKWFVQSLERTPLSRRPSFDSEDAVVSAFKTYILQDIAIKKGFNAGVDLLFSYRWKVNDMISGLLYDAYLKHLVNIVPKPDSSSVKKYYNENKNEKYVEDEMVSVREIRVSSRELADSLLAEVRGGVDFSFIVEKYGLSGPGAGDLSGPFSRKQGSKFFDAVSMLKINEYSSVFSTTNNSFSILKLIERFPSRPLSLGRVYSRIESLLLKELQEASKARGINGLSEKYVVNQETSLLY